MRGPAKGAVLLLIAGAAGAYSFRLGSSEELRAAFSQRGFNLLSIPGMTIGLGVLVLAMRAFGLVWPAAISLGLIVVSLHDGIRTGVASGPMSFYVAGAGWSILALIGLLTAVGVLGSKSPTD